MDYHDIKWHFYDMNERLSQIERLQRWTVESNWRRQGLRKSRSNAAIGEEFFRKLPGYDLWLVTEGQALIEADDGTVSLIKRGSLIFHRPGLFRRLWQEKGEERLAVIFLHFQLYDMGSRQPVPFEETGDFAPIGETDNVEFAELLCMQILRVGLASKKTAKKDIVVQQAYANQALKALLFQLLAPVKRTGAKISVSNVKRHRQILGMAERIGANPERFHSVSEMAHSLYLSQAYFTRLFTELIGKAPVTLLIESRVQKAKQYLRGSDLTVKQIAEELGYRDTYFFCRQFKKLAGITPMQFRTKKQQSR